MGGPWAKHEKEGEHGDDGAPGDERATVASNVEEEHRQQHEPEAEQHEAQHF
jgi:hypothetical protein